MMKLQPGHEIANRRTDRRTDRQTDGQTDDGDHNIIRPFGRIKRRRKKRKGKE